MPRWCFCAGLGSPTDSVHSCPFPLWTIIHVLFTLQHIALELNERRISIRACSRSLQYRGLATFSPINDRWILSWKGLGHTWRPSGVTPGSAFLEGLEVFMRCWKSNPGGLGTGKCPAHCAMAMALTDHFHQFNFPLNHSHCFTTLSQTIWTHFLQLFTDCFFLLYKNIYH